MTTERRLAKVESSLSPTGLVLRWLAEAHAFDDLETYAAWHLDEAPAEMPLDRLAREAAEGARAGGTAESGGWPTQLAAQVAVAATAVAAACWE